MKKIIILFCLGSLFSTLSFAGTKDFYNFKWLGKDKNIYVLQNKIFVKKGSKYINLLYGSSDLSDFQDSTVGGLQVGYFFTEEWGFEVSYASYSNTNNDSYDAISETTNFVPFVRKFESINSLNLIFSPFYGKINTFNKIIYLDWSFGFGFSQIAAKTNRDSFLALATTDSFESESLTGFNLKTSWRVYYSESFHFHVEFGKVYFNAEKPEEGDDTKLYDSSEFTFGVGFNF